MVFPSISMEFVNNAQLSIIGVLIPFMPRCPHPMIVFPRFGVICNVPFSRRIAKNDVLEGLTKAQLDYLYS